MKTYLHNLRYRYNEFRPDFNNWEELYCHLIHRHNRWQALLTQAAEGQSAWLQPLQRYAQRLVQSLQKTPRTAYRFCTPPNIMHQSPAAARDSRSGAESGSIQVWEPQDLVQDD